MTEAEALINVVGSVLMATLTFVLFDPTTGCVVLGVCLLASLINLVARS